MVQLSPRSIRLLRNGTSQVHSQFHCLDMAVKIWLFFSQLLQEVCIFHGMFHISYCKAILYHIWGNGKEQVLSCTVYMFAFLSPTMLHKALEILKLCYTSVLYAMSESQTYMVNLFALDGLERHTT